MGFNLSPAVIVNEIDLTNIIPAIATSNTALVGDFAWGPVNNIQVISDENQFVNFFWKPNDRNFRDWFTGASYLAYAKGLFAVRVAGTGALNAAADEDGAVTGVLVENDADYENSNFSTELWIAKYPGALGNSLKVAWANAARYNAVDSNGTYTWPYRDVFDYTPDVNEYNIVVVDADGSISGTADTVLERFELVSTVPGAMKSDGTSAFFKTVINLGSRWIWVGEETLLNDDGEVTLANGSDGSAPTDGQRQAGWTLFQNAEEVDVQILCAGNASRITSKWIIDNVAETRRDCVALVSPEASDILGIGSIDTVLDNIVDCRNFYASSTYAIMDGNYKYIYDRYNDVYRWIPFNGDLAGLLARTDYDRDPWWSPGGLTRGRLKNVIKLAWKPSKTYRDELYKNGVNPITSFPADGPVLFGDKTLSAKPSAFDRINVRRLFIVLEKAISTAARYFLFEFNDEFTRNQFVNMVEPFLRDVQGRRGVYDFRVVCDETNNTGEVIDRNEFVGDIYIKPARSINTVILNFIAVRTAVAFEEVIQPFNTSPTL